MKPAGAFILGALAGGAVAVAIVVVLSHPPPHKTFAQEVVDLSEPEMVKLESKAQRLFTKGSYPIFASHVRSAELAMSIFDRSPRDEIIRRYCADELAIFLSASRSAAADRELVGIWPLIQEKQKTVEKFVRDRPQLQTMMNGLPNQPPLPTPASVAPPAAAPVAPPSSAGGR